MQKDDVLKMQREEAEKRTVLRCLVGSTIHGLGIEGQDDRDEMGVVIEPLECVIGLNHFEQFIHRDQPEGVRSQPGDLDLTLYSLRKWCRLALAGNPTILLLLYVPEEHCMKLTPIGQELRDLAWAFVSKRAGKAFLGYLTSQKERLVGTRGQMRNNRPELIEKYGFDTKYAMHMVRLGIQGVEFMQTGKLTLPVPQPQCDYIRAVRTGQVPLQEVLTDCGLIAAQLVDLLDSSPLPDNPDHDAVNEFLVRVYSSYNKEKENPYFH